MSDSMEVLEITPSGALYEESRRVRGKVLREPLGMGSVVETFPFEHEAWHFIARSEGKVVGTVLFHPRGTEGRLFQMAVLEDFRGRGTGRRLVESLERTVQERGMKAIFLHARHGAVSYYESLGYEVVGEPFLEIGLEHFMMRKSLPGVPDAIHR